MSLAEARQSPAWVCGEQAEWHIGKALRAAGCKSIDMQLLSGTVTGGWMLCINLSRPRMRWPWNFWYRNEMVTVYGGFAQLMTPGMEVADLDGMPLDPFYRLSSVGQGSSAYFKNWMGGAFDELLAQIS